MNLDALPAPSVSAPLRGWALIAALLRQLTWPEWCAHAWRQSAAWVAVALGVALGLSVHLINEAALSEFGAAARAANGQPDASLRCQPTCDDVVFDQLVALPQVQSAQPVVAFSSYLVLPSVSDAGHAKPRRVAVQVVGVDALGIAAVAPDLFPQVAEGQDRLALIDPDRVFANAAALAQTGLKEGDEVALQVGTGTAQWVLAGQVAAAGPPLLVVDIDAAQARLGFVGQLSRVDLRLQPGATATQVREALGSAWPAGARWYEAGEDEQALSAMSRAYRVNLTVLALVALFVGAFLVFSVMALSVAQRLPQLALLGVLGLSAAERRRWVLAEAAAAGVLGASVGVVLGLGLALLALRWLAGDLGGGFFPGVAPQLVWSWPAVAGFWALGVLAAAAGGWLPALQVQAMAPAQALKGLGGTQLAPVPAWVAPLLLVAGVGLALLPPVWGLPLAAYASVGCLLLGGVVAVPWAVDGLLRVLAWGGPPRHAAGLLALERARHERHAATVAVAGVVASLSLAVALTVMVSSFREGVTGWLDQVLPADMYVRTATRSVASDGAHLPPGFAQQAEQLPGVVRAQASRLRSLALVPGTPAVTLVARPLPQPERQLPLLAPPWTGPAPLPDMPSVYVSEAMVALHGAQPGQVLLLPLGKSSPTPVLVRGVWRDYARQFGTVVMHDADYRAITGDALTNDLALWLAPGARADSVQAGLRELAGGSWLEFAVPADIRAQSLRIFDRSFAVTRYLQVLAIGIGLFGIAASFSAQVLARRREFGLLAHLGFTRRQVVATVAAEGVAWTAGGAVLGVALGLAVAAVLVFVVNPQSFHWTMPLVVPWDKLAALVAGVVLAGGLAAGISARAAASVQAVRAVKEDW